MTVDEFLAWAEDRPGRYELLDGIAYGMAPERAGHARAKAKAHRALEEAVARAGLPCEAMADGMTVRIDARTAYEPDALVYCGEPIPNDAVEVPAPVIVVEVLWPGTRGTDTGLKLAGYFALPSVRHYLLIDPAGRMLVHHARNGDAIATRIMGSGLLTLDPPGLALPVDDLLRRDRSGASFVASIHCRAAMKGLIPAKAPEAVCRQVAW